MIYDGENCIVGRVAAYTAKQALKGEKLEIYNAEKMVFTGRRNVLVEKYKHRRSLRDHAKPVKSPKFPRRPDLFVKRIIKGMLPSRSIRGRDALKRIKVYMDAPKEGAKKIFELKKDIRYITIGQICKELGWEE